MLNHPNLSPINYIDNKIEIWHRSKDIKQDLHLFVGFKTLKEYWAFVMNGEIPEYLIDEWKNNRT